MGRGMIWPFGGEHWCNKEGTYLHIVSDLSHMADQDYEMSICSLGVIGTRYVRDGQPLPAEITLFNGERWLFSLPHIYSDIEIGTVLAIDVRESTNTDILTITNGVSATDLLIDATGLEPGKSSFVVVLESFNALSSV